jgi:large subunit ribosomal protein L10
MLHRPQMGGKVAGRDDACVGLTRTAEKRNPDMNRSEKQELVTELREKMKGATALYYTDFTGLNVKGMTELRRRLRKAGVQYVVIKNTLAVRAVSESGLVGTKLRGPTGLVISADPVVAAKVLTDFAKEFEQRPSVKGGLLDGREIVPAQVKQLSAMPTRERMLAELGAGLQSPLAAFVGALNGLLFMFVGALTALHTQRETAAPQG